MGNEHPVETGLTARKEIDFLERTIAFGVKLREVDIDLFRRREHIHTGRGSRNVEVEPRRSGVKGGQNGARDWVMGGLSEKRWGRSGR